MNQTRKRLRSEDENFALQTKYFVNQKLVNESNGKLMSEVYGEKIAQKLWVSDFESILTQSGSKFRKNS